MHPPLTIHKHPGCAEVIRKFKQCHDNHPVAKFWGACNDLKDELDACFREEKAERRRANLEAARHSKERLLVRKAKAAAEGRPLWTERSGQAATAAAKSAPPPAQ
eukprot:TRINITY_DN12089_c0_g2_i1.p1 TRINITY_DN12089_c0_g2~~TRINITY_DN12089_c0_g2_i1.p1  ORF type:complete len:105 (-),score=24.87 TRINITY_DN12089_c0_g2_i1:571-885(-)